MKIEKASLRDVPEILELQYKAFGPVSKELDWPDAPPVTETLEQAYADFPNSTVLKMVADDGRIIGSVRGRTDDGSLYIGRLMVLPEFQQNGYGKVLLHEIQSILPHNRAWLGTSGETKKTIEFYEREGFRTFKTETFDNGHVWISMEKIRPQNYSMTNFEVTISTDYNIIKTLFVEYSQIKGAEGCFISFEKELADLAAFYKGGAILVGFEDGAPIATIALKKVDDDIAEVKRLFIKPEHRGKGYSRKMLEAMFQCAKSLGYKEVMLTTRPEVMPVAYALYKRIGFNQTDFKDGVATMRIAIAK